MEGANNHAIFIDWITASQLHPKGGLPILTGGLFVQYDSSGVPRFERNCPTSYRGSFDTSIRVACNGARVFLSGNPGRFARPDNLYNYRWEGTKQSTQRILTSLSLPAFGPPTISSCEIKGGQTRGAVVSRLDLTGNFSTGSIAQGRALIQWLTSQSLKRMKRGSAGCESVWFSNTRTMFKAYIKGVEMIKHGADPDSQEVQWCNDNGIVRIEVELKKRLLSELGINAWEQINDEKLEEVFISSTEILRRVDRSDDLDLINEIPRASRPYAAAWLAGTDLHCLCSERTLYRHAKVLRGYGLDVMQKRNIIKFPTKVRVIDMKPEPMPNWYSLKEIG